MSAVAATGSSVIMQVLTLAMGLGVVLLTGAKLIGQHNAGDDPASRNRDLEAKALGLVSDRTRDTKAAALIVRART